MSIREGNSNRSPVDQHDPVTPGFDAGLPPGFDSAMGRQSETVPATPDTTGTGRERTDSPAAGFDAKGRVRRTRVSGVWIGLITAAVFLILLVVFIAQNTAKASIHFLGLNGHMAVGLTILIAAIVGLLIAAVPGSIRILQLRRALKRNTPTEHRSGTRG